MAVRAVASEPEPEQEFDLNEIVLEHIKRHDSPDPYEIAREVRNEISDDELDEVVELLLPIYVRERLDGYRRSQQKRKRSKKGKNTESVKWVATDDWDDIFWTSVSVPDVGRKWLGDCTRDDIAAIVGDYEDKASELQAKADAYSEILSAMKRRRVTVASELPAELVMGAFGGEE